MSVNPLHLLQFTHTQWLETPRTFILVNLWTFKYIKGIYILINTTIFIVTEDFYADESSLNIFLFSLINLNATLRSVYKHHPLLLGFYYLFISGFYFVIISYSSVSVTTTKTKDKLDEWHKKNQINKIEQNSTTTGHYFVSTLITFALTKTLVYDNGIWNCNVNHQIQNEVMFIFNFTGNCIEKKNSVTEQDNGLDRTSSY